MIRAIFGAADHFRISIDANILRCAVLKAMPERRSNDAIPRV
ncbi:hypothetical protein [Mesorhizobium sp. INR15]|nr:hypothetical protein [Mesorhizobium sp. INR15]